MTVVATVGNSSATRTTAAPSAIQPAHLLAYAMACEGIPCTVSIRGMGQARSNELGGPAPRVAIVLRKAIPAETLLQVLRRFENAPHACCVILGRTASEDGYRERLHLDHDAVIRVERLFRSPTAGNMPPRVLGVIARELPRGVADNGRPASVLAVLRQCAGNGGSIETACVSLERTLDRDAAAGDALAFLSAQERQRLARRLRWKAVGVDVYASPNATLSEQALLRGPLFIEEGASIGAEDIHIGPAWLRPGAPAVTVGAENDSGRTDVAAMQAMPRQYFTAPAARPRPGYAIAKRLFDVLFSLLVLLIVSPLMLLAALAVKFSDWGPVFFVHTREGVGGRPFGCVKFRTMVRDADALKEKLRRQNQVDGPQFKIAHDPRITRIGRFLRKTNIDELPQFWNVLMGDMSVVGPRPSPFKENQLCPPWREARLSVKPGITGLWQVSRSRERGAADFQEWIFYDTQYVERRGFWLDIKIILLTLKELLGKGQ